MAPRRNPVRATRTGPATVATGRRGRRPRANVETRTPENHDATNHTAEDPNLDAQGDNEPIPTNTPTVDPNVINQLVDQRVAELLAESNHSNASAGTSPTVRPLGCSYKEYRACGPVEFCGTEGVVYLVRWIEKTESVFTVSNCSENAKVKFATFTLKDEALTWWNNYRRSIGDEEAYAMTWDQFKSLLVKTYCPRNEVKKLEAEFWNHKVKGNDMSTYTRRYQELSLLCPDMVNTEALKIERYTDGLPLATRNDVIAARPANIHECITIAKSLMDSIALESGEKEKKDKRKRDDKDRSNHKKHKRQENARVFAIGNGERKGYVGDKPLCGKCKKHHHGRCAMVYNNCSKPGHLAKDCRTRPLAVVQTTQGGGD